MCNRTADPPSYETFLFLVSLWYGSPTIDPLQRRWNIAPTNNLMAITSEENRQNRPMRWGLIPRWAIEPTGGPLMANARSETVFEKPAFRDNIRDRRCLVPVSGFYEWQTHGKQKLPHFLSMADGGPMAIAAIWDQWQPPTAAANREPLQTVSLLTTASNELVGELHDRMPVILPQEQWADWLDPAPMTQHRAQQLLVALPANRMRSRPVSPYVNDVRHDGPRCQEPPQAQQLALL
jgi:putative SOS response-associated peptidase YedK